MLRAPWHSSTNKHLGRWCCSRPELVAVQWPSICVRRARVHHRRGQRCCVPVRPSVLPGRRCGHTAAARMAPPARIRIAVGLAIHCVAHVPPGRPVPHVLLGTVSFRGWAAPAALGQGKVVATQTACGRCHPPYRMSRSGKGSFTPRKASRGCRGMARRTDRPRRPTGHGGPRYL